MGEILKTFKGFNRDMTCRGKKYEEGKVYVEEKAVACNTGMHACEYPLDCFTFYPPGTSVYHEVEQSGDISKKGNDSKVASTEMRIGARIGIRGLVRAAIEFTKSRTTTNHTDPEKATAGNYGAATVGDYGAATSRGSSATGENGISVARGNDVKVKGGLDAVLVICEEEKDSYDIHEWKTVVVDGEKIKADTWYKLENGEFKEVE